MSLVKQLWIAIVAITALAFGGSLVISILSARHYLEQQLQVKNIDNANALALALSQLRKSPVTMELQLSAQFDVGHYRFIRIVSPSGQVMVEKVFSGQAQGAPLWFTRLIPIQAQPGQAQIQDGWRQYGSLILASHEQYAYQSLWQGALQLLLWFAGAGLLIGLVASLVLRLITRPLSEVVRQAQAIEQRRFLQIQEPKTPELRSVVRAMNSMGNRLKALFAKETARLEALRQRINHDPLTGLASREHFLAMLRAMLLGETASAQGSLLLLRINKLELLNTQLGSPRTNTLLKQVAQILKVVAKQSSGAFAGHLRGADFALVWPDIDSPLPVLTELQQRLQQPWLDEWVAEVPDLYHLAGISYQRGQSLSELMNRADEALAFAQTKGPNSLYVDQHPRQIPALSADQWRQRLSAVVGAGGHGVSPQLKLSYWPVRALGRANLLHQEGILRWQLEAGGPLLVAGDFMPIAANLQLSAALDRQLVRLALESLRNSNTALAINLAAASIADFGFRQELLLLLQANSTLCSRLYLEVSEYGVNQQVEAFDDLLHSLKPLGCRFGIEHYSQGLSQGHQLADLGLDYIKVHPSYCHDLASHPENQAFLKDLCALAHMLGISVIAAGLDTDADLALLNELGFDGASDPLSPALG
ncbi:MAG: LapD/MoxY N-terminal periplasmic domain-containing protein [Burkholderiaceae bacterium]